MNRKRQSNNAHRNQSFINIFGRTAIVSVGLFLSWQLFSMTVFSAVPVEARVSTPLLSTASDLLNIGSLPSATSALSGLSTGSLLQPLSAVSNVLTLNSLGSGTTLDKVINRWLKLGDFGSIGNAAIHGSFLKILQTDLSDFFGYAAFGFPGTIPTPPGLPALPVPPFVRDQFVKKVAAKWGASLGSAEYKKGLAGWLALWPGASAPDRLVFAACALYPWTPAMPDAVKSFKDGYCSTALPAALASKLLPPLPPPLAIAKKTLDAQVNMAQTAMLVSHVLP